MNEEYLKGLTKEELIEIIYNETTCTYQLQNNWNELKKWLEDYIKATEEDYKQTSTEGCKKTQETIITVAKNFLKKMQELEQGKDE